MVLVLCPVGLAWSSIPEPLLAWGDSGISVLLGWLMVWLVTAVMGVTWLHWELVSLRTWGSSPRLQNYVFIYLYLYIYTEGKWLIVESFSL